MDQQEDKQNDGWFNGATDHDSQFEFQAQNVLFYLKLSQMFTSHQRFLTR